MTCPQCEKCHTPMRDTGFDQAVWHSTYQCDTCLQTRLMTAPRPLTSVIEWVPVSERLPEERETVLVVTTRGTITKAQRYTDLVCEGGGYWAEIGGYGIDVVLWAEMPPLPQLPASEEEKG